MAKPAKKIWCPQCHKRHRLPADTHGGTLRCRGCKFAFLVEDGLHSDPADSAEAAVIKRAAAESSTASPTKKRCKHETNTKKNANVNAKAAGTAKANPAGANTGTSSSTAVIENDYDDILSVLERPTSDQPPVRVAAAKPQQRSRTAVSAENLAEQPQRPPITREQLRAHRNARQVWMLASFLTACLLGLVCFLYVNVWMSPQIGSWERRMLYSFGVPARWLPPTEEGDESLPPAHVKLRGDHADLANRNDFFKDDFTEKDAKAENAVGNDDAGAANHENHADADERFGAGRGLNRRNGIANRNLPRGAAGNRGNVGRGANPRRAAVGRPPARRQPRGAQPNWSPPKLAATDLRRVVNRGIDPKFIRSVLIDDSVESEIQLSGQTLFFVDSRNHLVAWSLADGGQRAAHQKLRSDVAALCPVAASEISTRDGTWVHYGSGRLERWELDGKNLTVTAKIDKTIAVFKEKQALFSASEDRLAFVHNGKIVSADYLPTAGRITDTVKVPVSGNVLALKLSADGQAILVVTPRKALSLDSKSGELIEEFPFADELSRSLQNGKQSAWISDDLSTVFLLRNGAVISLDLKSGDATASGLYWPNSPFPLQSVFGNREVVAASASTGDSAEITLFNITAMVPDNFVSAGPAKAVKKPNRETSKKHSNAAGELVTAKSGAAPLPNQPFLASLSPTLNQRIIDLHYENGKVAILTGDRTTRRLAVADIENQWKFTSLNIRAGKINHFSISPDFEKFVVSTGQAVQSWRVDNFETGEAALVAEFAGHVAEVSRVKLMPGGEHVVSGDFKGRILTWNFETGEQIGSIEKLRSEVINIVPISESAFAAMDRTGSLKGSLRSARKAHPFPRPVSGPVAMSGNGAKIAFSFANEVKISGTSNFRKVEGVGNNAPVLGISFAKDQRHVLLRDREQVALWDYRKKQRVRRFRIPGKVCSGPVAVSADGRSVAIAIGRDSNQIAIFELPINDK